MASAAAPSTPTSSSSQTPKPASSSPTGTWRHPRFDDIVRRQSASAFTDSNVRKIIWNAGTLIGSLAAGRMIPLIHPWLADLAHNYPYPFYAISLLRMLWLVNIIIALMPLIKPKDDLSDIPLTPSQRALLGLDPNVGSPLKPGSQYITPPRYPRSSTSHSGTPGSRGSNYSSSPLSGKGSAARPAGGPSFSPSASPLLQKAVASGGRELTRRQSYGSPSPMGGSGSGLLSSVAAPATPSPTGGKGASVTLNSRWLYERGRGSPSGSKLFS